MIAVLFLSERFVGVDSNYRFICLWTGICLWTILPNRTNILIPGLADRQRQQAPTPITLSRQGGQSLSKPSGLMFDTIKQSFVL